ncbi:uncharacterized protein ACA1_000560 [Acanthamoeba castellanii str. Neff]|uniref:Uncharacterized protein n=1 Tax=Acanthamoeba castellanii (strain ATCC 30010 / Neff) TaxID=1257118 RepID=L8GSB1_ACACF|nr:uncharacterized protein ACA1_000560 [Acanthamoeba castellanii str. Neff]ELR15488.1 hypothetical protein ACA1_000560 [Acanthamoeba castellanii str. Neff]
MGSTKNSNKQQEQPAALTRKPVKPVELRCKLCNSEFHRSVQCEDRCRGTRCVELKLHTHAWAECPFKTRPFCQLCGDTDHGVFKHDCIHRCYVHDSWVHLIGHCPTFCDDCGLSGHRARSQVCTMRNRRRTAVAARRTSAPAAPVVEPVAPQKSPKQQNAAAAAGLPAKKAGLEKKREEEEAAKKKRAEEEKRRAEKEEKKKAEAAAAEAAVKAKEEKLRQALVELKKEKLRIVQELAQLQASKQQQPKVQASPAQKAAKPVLAVPITTTGGRVGLRQSRG